MLQQFEVYVKAFELDIIKAYHNFRGETVTRALRGEVILKIFP